MALWGARTDAGLSDFFDQLVRLEVTHVEPRGVVVPEPWGEAEVLAVYDLHAHRMTEIGTDIAVEGFAAPVDIFLIGESEMEGLRFGIHNDTWTLAPPTTLPLDALEQAGIPASQGWAAASISQLRRVCLARIPPEGDG